MTQVMMYARRCASRGLLFVALAATVMMPASSILHADDLKSKEAFAGIADEKARGIAMFEELGKVLKHPRCVNCHPVGNAPLQGEAMQPHEPPVQRGPANFGVAGMRCTTCHMPRNVD